MQCPETPRLDLQQDLAVVSCTAPSTGTIRRRTLTTRRSTPVFQPGRHLHYNKSTPCHNLSRAKATNSKQQTAVSVATSRASELSDSWNHPDDVLESRSKSHAAALQFHNAAQRLALSPLFSNTTSHVQDGDVFDNPNPNREGLFDTPTSSPQRTTSLPKQTARYRYPERDITSARRDSTYLQYQVQGETFSPYLASKTFADGSPAPNYQKRIGCGERQKTRVLRNFSRPVFNSPARTLPMDFSKRNSFRPIPASFRATPLPLGREGRNFSRPMRPTRPKSTQQPHTSLSNSKLAYVPTIETAIPPHEAGLRNFAIPQQARSQEEAVPAVVTKVLTSAEFIPNSQNCPDQLNSGITAPQSFEDPTRKSFDSAVSECLGDKCIQLPRWEILLQRVVFSLFVFTANIALGLAYLGAFKHPYLLAILVFMKSKDTLSTVADILGLLHNLIRQRIWPPKPPSSKWILSLVCAYAETEEQILKTVYSLARGKTSPHKQAICIILDGKPRNILGRMSAVKVTVQRPYTTWRGTRGEIVVNAGLLEGIPLILVQKVKNAGKKDSLILGHDLFNFPREDMPQSTRMLRTEIWRNVLPVVLPTTEGCLEKFDFVFCTDADSTIHDYALQRLANALCLEDNAIAGCGVLFAEFGDRKTEYSPWHLFQQFQYTFGQYVRRQAESTWGRVTCLPGCITMIVVRPEMGRAVSEYARPVVEHNLFRHQVQYLGTDRRLTWCMMSQGKHLRTVFVPDALSETVVPDGISHYLSQRRRWASNAYFNDFFYFLGPRQRLVTRLFAAIDIVRLTLVYYRVFNTGYFLHGLITNFYVIKIIPTLVVTKTPATWYLLLVVIREPFLRRRLHKILLGMCINQVISPILSVIVFTNVLFHMGSQAWGKTGASTQGVAPVATAAINGGPPPAQNWTPKRLAKSIQTAIWGMTPTRHHRKSNLASSHPRSVQGSISRSDRSKPRTEHDAPLSSHPPDTAVVEKINAEIFRPEPVIKQSTDTSSSVYTPAPKLRHESLTTPGTLTKRKPYHRARPSPRLDTLRDIPVRATHDSTSGLNFEE